MRYFSKTKQDNQFFPPILHSSYVNVKWTKEMNWLICFTTPMETLVSSYQIWHRIDSVSYIGGGGGACLLGHLLTNAVSNGSWNDSSNIADWTQAIDYINRIQSVLRTTLEIWLIKFLLIFIILIDQGLWSEDHYRILSWI